jgi:hypothetical protein
MVSSRLVSYFVVVGGEWTSLRRAVSGCGGCGCSALCGGFNGALSLAPVDPSTIPQTPKGGVLPHRVTCTVLLCVGLARGVGCGGKQIFGFDLWWCTCHVAPTHCLPGLPHSVCTRDDHTHRVPTLLLPSSTLCFMHVHRCLLGVMGSRVALLWRVVVGTSPSQNLPYCLTMVRKYLLPVPPQPRLHT